MCKPVTGHNQHAISVARPSTPERSIYSVNLRTFKKLQMCVGTQVCKPVHTWYTTVSKIILCMHKFFRSFVDTYSYSIFRKHYKVNVYLIGQFGDEFCAENIRPQSNLQCHFYFNSSNEHQKINSPKEFTSAKEVYKVI